MRMDWKFGLLTLLVTAGLAPAGADFSSLKKDLTRYYHGQKEAAKGLAALKETDLALTRDQFLQIEKSILEDRAYKEEKGGEFEEGLSAEAAGIKTGFVYTVPPGYTPGKKWPMMIFMHGGDFEKTGTFEQLRVHAKQIRGWFTKKFTQDWFVVIPVTPEGYGEKSWRKTVWATMEFMKNKFRIDPDRIYLGGGSMGAYGAWETCLFFGDRFAGLLSCAGGFGYEDYAPACLTMPVFLAHGMKDPNVQPENSQTNYDVLKGLGYPVEFVKYPKHGHAIPYHEIFDKSKAWFEDKKRTANPKKIIWVAPDARYFKSVKGEPMRHYWLEVLEVEGKYPRIEAAVQDNKVTVTTKSIKKITLFLNDHLADLDRPVEISINGQVVKTEKLTRSAKPLIDRRDDFFARGLLYTTSITLDIPTAK